MGQFETLLELRPMLALPNVPDLQGDRLEAFQQGFEKLTTREKQVAQAIVEGQTSKQAAKRLGISPRTVEVHRGRVFDKLGVRGAAELVRMTVASHPGGEPVATAPAKPALPSGQGDLDVIASTKASLARSGDAPMGEILRGIAYRRHPSADAINVFMMWDRAGETSGYLLVPDNLETALERLAYPVPGLARPLNNAISYGLLLALRGGLPLFLTGERLVWEKSWGTLPSLEPDPAHRSS
jgi:DNA-binding CsgD family transcriptional regulator